MKPVRIGTRGSALAMKQAELVKSAIENYDPARQVEIILIKTTGDKHPERPLEEMGGKQVFVRELEQALLDGAVDLCVHSLKDMSVEENKELPICAVSAREDPRDALVLPENASSSWEQGPIGTSSLRRRIQLRAIYPGCVVEPLRGNVPTRIRKLDEGLCSALVVAAAGLNRLGLAHRASTLFTVQQMIPACGQGIIAVQGRAGEPVDFLKDFHSADSWDAALAERSFLRTMGGGCHTPATAHAVLHGDALVINGYSVDESGRMVPGTRKGDRKNAEELGRELAANLMAEASLC